MKPVSLVSDYMSRDLITLSPENEINHAMSILLENNISGVPVLDKSGALAGILTEKDCLKAAMQASYYRTWGTTVAEHMSENVETIDAGQDIFTATTAFLNSVYRRFPVMEDGRLVGQISRTDALRAMKDNWG
ncbi:MAG: CBS domain-containing protein [Rhodobacteraceae bacterium]|nr:CBS domain-containing protein [Alphaproteobacteria bacterium]MBT8475513.1 CBS domain-containing protein [Alphaproteobacteria bacterium]NNF72161.1 CBS domain-containing protein [Paracoccaceae bacterium]NNK68714.1 CBS domain-containing protein [Paracoccaceae bacterium]